MSGPVRPPLTVAESDGNPTSRPCNTISFNSADFVVIDNGATARIDLVPGGGAGASLANTLIGFGDAAGLLTGSANFTFTDESGGNGPTVLLTGDKPEIKIQDDTAATDYFTSIMKSGHSLIFSQEDSTGNDTEFMRFGSSSILFNDDGASLDVKIKGNTVDELFVSDGGLDSIGIGTVPGSGGERLHIAGKGQTAPMVQIEATDDPGISGANPCLRLYNSSTPGTNLQGGKLEFSAKNDAGSEFVYGSIGMTIRDSTANEDGSLESRVAQAGTESTAEYMRIGTASQAIFLNPGAVNIDTAIADETGNLFYLDATNANVGIGTYGRADTDVERLHVKGTGDGTLVRLESTDTGAGSAPELALYRSATASTDDVVGQIRFQAKSATGSINITAATMYTQLKAVSGTAMDSILYFDIRQSNSSINALKLGNVAAVFNESGANLDFRIESSSEPNCFFLDASENNVGIGGAPESSARLHVTEDGTKSFDLLLENTDNDANNGPTLSIWRNSATPANGDDCGRISWYFENDAGSRHLLGRLRSEITTVTAGSEDSRLYFTVFKAGTEVQTVAMRHSEVVINDGSHDINFRVESDGNSSMLLVDAGLNMVSISNAPVAGGATLQVPDNTISSYANVVASTASPMTLTNNDLQSMILVHTGVSALTVNLPLDGGVKGQYFQFVSSSGDVTIVPSAVAGDTINGGTASLTRSTNNELYDCLCIASNTWILSNPA